MVPLVFEAVSGCMLSGRELSKYVFQICTTTVCISRALGWDKSFSFTPLMSRTPAVLLALRQGICDMGTELAVLLRCTVGLTAKLVCFLRTKGHPRHVERAVTGKRDYLRYAVDVMR